MTFKKGYGILHYTFAVFESTENVSVSFKSEDKFENEEKKNSVKRVFIGCSIPGNFSCCHTIRSFYSCFRLHYMFSCITLMGLNVGSVSLLFARKEKNKSFII